MKPILNNLIIERIAEGEKTASGIILTGSLSVLETHPKARVKGCGCGKKGKKQLIKTGETILYERNSEIDIEIDGKDITLLNYQSVIAIV